MTSIYGGAIKDMTPEIREELESFLARHTGLPVHPYTGEILLRRDTMGLEIPLKVKVVTLN